MKFRLLMFDGRPVRYVTSERIVFSSDKDTLILHPIDTTMESLENNHRLCGQAEKDYKANLRKCDLEDVELRFLKRI